MGYLHAFEFQEGASVFDRCSNIKIVLSTHDTYVNTEAIKKELCGIPIEEVNTTH